MTFTVNATVGETVDFSLNTPEKKNVAETLNDIANQLMDDSLNGDALESALADALVGLDNGMETINLERSSLGGRLNIAESIYETNLDLELTAKDAKANIVETDYAEASTEFAKQEAALSAALATFPRVSGLSLFDYIG